MAVTQYIGARYVPTFGRVGDDTIDWDSSKTYEPLTIVLNQGNSYTSRQYVPVGIDISNGDYWALTGNYNAQIDAYRSQVTQLQNNLEGYDTDIAANASAITENASKISTHETTIASIQSDIANYDSEITANASAIAENASAITAETARAKAAEAENFESQRNAYKAWTGRKAIIIGDSFSAPSSSQEKWPYYLAQSLGFTYRNYAVGATGFIDPGNNTDDMRFVNQVNKAANELSQNEREEIDYVFVFGGYNDVSRSDANASAMQTAAGDVSAAIMTSFPNALIICIPMNWRVDKFTSTARNYATAITYGMTRNTSAPVRIINYVWTWLFCSTGSYSSDELHPNDNGYKQLAKFIEANLLGNELVPRPMQKFEFESGFSYYENSNMPIVDGDTVIIPSTYINTTNAISSATKIATAPAKLISSGGQWGTVYKGNVPVGGWTITTSGNINVVPNSGTTISDGFYLGGTTYPIYGVATS